MLLFTKIKGSFCNMSSYNQSLWIALLTSSRLLVSVRIMVLSTAPWALELKRGRENISAITGSMEWATSLSRATAEERTKVQPGGVGHFISILLNYVYFLPSSNGHVDFSEVWLLNSKCVPCSHGYCGAVIFSPSWIISFNIILHFCWANAALGTGGPRRHVRTRHCVDSLCAASTM